MIMQKVFQYIKTLWEGDMADSQFEVDPYVYEVLAEAKHIVALTGAGISSESGIPTFRGKEGLWKKFSPEELANFRSFMENPELVTEWYQHRREIINRVEPNPAHYALVDMENIFAYVTIITQNVDGLHQKAGSTNVIELHGNIFRNYCIDCGKRFDYNKLPLTNGIPRCTDCNGYIRPDVVWFGEALSTEAIQEAEHVTAAADVMFSIGTSAVVYPAAQLPRTAKYHDAYLVEINPEHTDISLIADTTIREPSGEALPQLLTHFQRWTKL